MILLDCGNSSLKAQQRTAGKLQASFSTRYSGDWSARLQRWMRDSPAKHCYLASVLDAGRQRLLENCLQNRFGGALTRFRSAARAGGVSSAYPQPDRLGVDRWLALIGAHSLVAGDCMIIDAGSAITLDLLRADGTHLGGAILPGINTSMERFRQIFGYIDFDDPAIRSNDQPASSTEAAIQIDYPHRSLDRLRDLVTTWNQHFDQNPALLLCGGDAPRVQAELGLPARIVPDLVFLGIHRLASV